MYILYILGYLFIVAGFLLFISVNSILIHGFKNRERLIFVPIIGIILTIFSRLADTIENRLVLIIFHNPDDYAFWLLTALGLVESTKWIIIGIEYSTLAIGTLHYMFTKVLGNNGEKEI